MEFMNNKDGREEALRLIARLANEGYSRTDVHGQKVVMSKMVQCGKICRRDNIKEFVFIRDAGKIQVNDTFKADGIEQAKNKLYGFTAPILEAANAVKAGLFAQEDYDILMMVCGETSWWRGQQ